MLPQRITALRKKTGLSQAQLAKALNISASAIGMYEQGRRAPNLDILVSMSRVFHVSLDYLVSGEEFELIEETCGGSTCAFPCPCSTCSWKKQVKASLEKILSQLC